MTELLRCDALVAGGGPAGLAAGIALRQKGLDVIVAEALRPPIDKACGEGLTPDSLRELARLGVWLEPGDGRPFSGIHFAMQLTDKTLLSIGKWRRSNGVALQSTGEMLVAAAFGGGPGIGIRRVDLHERLRARAEEIGVRLRWGSRVGLHGDGEVTVGGRLCRYKYLIGADGEASQVRRWAGLDGGWRWSRRLGFRRHYRIAPWSEVVEVHWGEGGQAYVTPVGEDEVCVAAITRHKAFNFDALLAGLPGLRERLGARATTGRERGGLTTTRRLRRVTGREVALVGDASGSVDAITGEGLASAFREALLLGEALGRDSLAAYEAGHAGILRLPQTMAAAMLAMDRWAPVRDRVMRMLAGSPELFAGLLAVHTGEQSLGRFVTSRGAQVGFRLLAPRRLPELREMEGLVEAGEFAGLAGKG